MYVVMNELYIPKEAKEPMKKRFGASANNMKEVPGCIEFMFLDNEKEDGKQVVFTKWESKLDYENWVNSDAFRKAHSERGKSGEAKKQEQPSNNELNAYEVVHHT
ncbi:antibiotic biosynthesis monooxygenase family protein [Bacillus solimangrovi]|uniref:Antibiotic biosynthesis monooxygenase n=1 Tax=Bacillus solimangrovi TaxID=1305675 RepID=A0A1E5LEK5_9BACI|nr:antibiotic biosynthesis monooxygenase [Bacillus solimangrovi]OEH92508.1 antibiotic biosynthesis monooxygenase [Bacillus solimangrovi]